MDQLDSDDFPSSIQNIEELRQRANDIIKPLRLQISQQALQLEQITKRLDSIQQVNDVQNSSNSISNKLTTQNIANYSDIFQRLPDHINGYILSFFKGLYFINLYDKLQGKIPVRIEAESFSRSNIIYSKNNILAIRSMEMSRCYNKPIVPFLQSFINLTSLDISDFKDSPFSFAMLLSNFHHLKQLSLSRQISPIIITKSFQ
jgi:hypothetical protein